MTIFSNVTSDVALRARRRQTNCIPKPIRTNNKHPDKINEPITMNIAYALPEKCLESSFSGSTPEREVKEGRAATL